MRVTPDADHVVHSGHTTDDVTALVHRWLEASRAYPTSGPASLLASLLRQDGGLPFLTQFVDGVIRPEDQRVAARNLQAIAYGASEFLPGYQRALLKLGAAVSRLVPRVVVTIARRVVRRMVSHLVVDATPRRLGPALSRLRAQGHRLNINLLGEAVLGQEEAARRLERTTELIRRSDVDYVSLKVSAAVAPHSPWAFERNVARIADTLRPVFREAVQAGDVFINLDMEEYKDLDLTMAVFTTVLDDDEFAPLTAGIVLQAYLPDSMDAMKRLQEWAGQRVARGGAPVKVRLVKGANLSMERVDAEIHGWPLATWHSKAESDAHYKRLIDYALDPERVAAVRVGIAGHNLFDIAHAHLTAVERGVTDAVDFEMLLGMAEHVARAVARDVGALRLYTPVVHPREFDVALAYLVRRLEEVASKQNFLSSLYDMDGESGADAFEAERARFAKSWELASKRAESTHRAAPREDVPANGAVFTNTPDTDPAVAANREWARGIAARAAASTLGVTVLRAARVDSSQRLDEEIGAAHAGAAGWQSLEAHDRAAVLRRAGESLESRRDQLIEVMMSEAGKTLEQADPEVSEAVDFAYYYAERSVELWATPGATPVPRRVTLVTPPWNFPVAIPAGSTLAALAAGSAVILKPAEQSGRCAAVLAQALWDAGVPRDVLRLIDIDPDVMGERLVTDERIEQVILTGAYETAQRFLGMRPDLRLFAETSGKNSIIVTPSADLDLAVRDVVASAFGHAGQKCSAASLVIAVGSAATSRRFFTQLRDAVTSVTSGPAWDLETQMGPVIEPVAGKLRRALTSLDEGESWLVEPESIDDAGKAWTPGLKQGVVPGSFFHLTECFGPVLGIMTAATLDEAIALQNGVDFGLTAGIHSLDTAEIATWLERVEAGNAYVNRGITGAIVQRQPFGGWKRSIVGPAFKAGGPHYLHALTDWAPAPINGGPSLSTEDRLRRFLTDAEAPSWVQAAVAADAAAWDDQFSKAIDRTGLVSEANVLRYAPANTDIHWDGSGSVDELIRVCAARIRAGGSGVLSAPSTVPEGLADALKAEGIAVLEESWEECLSRARQRLGARIRLVATAQRDGHGTSEVAVFAQRVTSSPALELMPFLKEQAVSITTHRFGTPFEAAKQVVGSL
ncbi:proline dehydrogenase family protein [Demequina sp. TTPB684]|uniref:proline dehydrogenase family protein n=1 Tax=unclassified Demequina TaxID=2620311 RepID=UPI001CF1B0D2|nr:MULTISPECIES: proline dehydrogenase family protein [unclassified Demequina]MCB2413795.1 proline dehydrogenase family protein [Demequina sp. TTPB684]UPU89297.1 proline dehydrogenase family protein [Demequina sp. TMPB413]